VTTTAVLPRRTTSLSARLTVALIPLVILPLVAMGVAAYLRAQQLVRHQATTELSGVVAAQNKILQSWAHAREELVAGTAQSAGVVGPTRNLLITPGAFASRSELFNALRSLQATGGDVRFTVVMVVRASDQQVLVASDQSIEGHIADAVRRGRLPLDRVATTPVYDDRLFAPGGLAIVTSAPIRARGDEVDAYLIGVNRSQHVKRLLDAMQALWGERAASGQRPGRTYLAVAPDLVATVPEYLFATEPEVLTRVSHPVFRLGPEHGQGFAEYVSLGDLPVVGAYEWAADQGIGVVLEVPQDEVYAGLTSLTPFFVILLQVTILAVVFLVPLATRRSLRPLTTLTGVVENLARGQFEQRVPIERADEVGRLAQSFNFMAGELATMYRSLEERVAERTRQIRTASEVARDAALIRDVDALLDQVVHLISDRFGYYHVGIFLVEGDDAVLRAASSEGGRRMLERGHRLAVGKVGIVGYATGTGKPRIALDVGADAVHFANPDLPHTRSEVALPLRLGERILGALDVQSTEPNAFEESDVVVLQTMADQLATALENARLVDSLSRQSADRQRVIEVTARLAQQTSYDQMLLQVTGEICHAFGFPRALLGLVEGDAIVIRSAADQFDPSPPDLGMVLPIGQGLLGKAIAHNEIVQEREAGRFGEAATTIAVPLVAPGRTIGALAVSREMTSPDDVELLRLLAVPLAAALENARLAEESQRSLHELDSLYRQQAAEAWQQILRARSTTANEVTFQPGAAPVGDEPSLAAPIEVRGEIIGALDVLGRAGAQLDREDEVILEAVAEELASALEQARLMEEIRRRAVQLQAAADVSRETTSQLDSATLLSRAVHLLHDRFGYDHVAVYRLDWNTSTAIVEAAAGKGAEALLAEGHQVPVGSASVIGYVTQSGNAYAASAEGDDPYFSVTPFLPDAKSELGLPLMIGDQVFGAIVIRHGQPNAFSRDDITVLEVLADQIAVGVQNARLFEATLRRAQREQKVIEITSKLRTSSGIDGILRTAVREMRQAMGARQAQIWLNAPAVGADGNGDRGDGREAP